jgi:hypothetical protein
MYATDKKAETEGTWIDLGEGLKVLIRRANSKASKAVRKRLEKPYLTMLRKDILPENIQEQINNRHVAEGILLGWEGVTDEKDKAIPFSVDAAIAVFTDLPDFRDDIVNFSVEAATFRSKALEDERGNSVTT